MAKNTITETAQDLNRLILGDNLEVLAQLPDESVDLIYLDPPFFSNRNYEVIWGDKGEVRSFEDRWSGGIDKYIDWLKERVVHMHRILKSTGSIFLHCDDHANAYIKVYILDKIFDAKNFKAEIIWKRSSAHNDSKQGRRALGFITDTIYYYSKSENYIYNHLYQDYKSKYVKSNYSHFDEEVGKYFKSSDLTAAKGGGDTLYEWKGKYPSKGRAWAYSKANLEKFEAEGRLFYTSGGMPRLKHYLDDMPGTSLQNLWDDINPAMAKERIGYPTQKPEALMERIIQMASNEGDVVLDPFVGGGTTVVVAERLKRRWIGIDQSVSAVKVTEQRLNNKKNLFSQPFTLELHKYDYDTLRYSDAFEFERFIIQQFQGRPNTKQKSDKGIDGVSLEGVPIQVKRSDNVSREVIDKLPTSAQRYDASIYKKRLEKGEVVAYLIAFSFGKGAIQEVSRLKNEENIHIKLVTVESIVEIAKKPRIHITAKSLGKDAKGLHEVGFVAKGESEAGIEFYSWDFAYDAAQGFQAEVFVDRDGEQAKKLKPGTHQIAIKAIDREGLEGMEVLTIQVNGDLQTR